MEFQRQHDDFFKRAAAVESGPGRAMRSTDEVMPRPQVLELEARAARLAIENDQLRVDRALLLAQLAAKDAEIRDLRAHLRSEAGGYEIEELPHRKLPGSARARSSLGTVRRGSPFIHPDDLAADNE